ncbi:MAG TPA: hypothetical protein VK524_07810 [Polyangiaceae bacterium]|nr:hypothetical protein [Polyangiaceae bacterium]
MTRSIPADSARRRVLLAAAVYALVTLVYFAFASRAVLSTHTQWNHFALLAEAWLHGRLDLGGPPPAYAAGNDFASFQGKWFVTFPPFPAVLLLPLVWIGKSATRVQDGQFFLWLAGLGPAFLFLGLEKLRRSGRSQCSTRTNMLLCLLFAFGTVYFFTAQQGSVWFAAHVVGVALAALYLLWSLDAKHPILAGLALGLGFMTRTPLLFAFPLFALEALRVSLRPSVSNADSAQATEPSSVAAAPEQLELPLAPEAKRSPAAVRGLFARMGAFWTALDKLRLLRLYVAFAAPIAVIIGVSFWHNQARFGDPFEVGYQYLTVQWQGRMQKWGLFHYHYLARNLGVVLTSLPYWPEPGAGRVFQVNTHGLALWFTTPVYLWLLWPRKFSSLTWTLWLTVLAVALPSLLYQNTGWLQFGYRFSNDYAVFLFALFAVGAYRFKALFWCAALWAVLVNAFGAATFGRAQFDRFYYVDASQRTLHQAD